MIHIDYFLAAKQGPAFVLEYLEHARRPAMHKNHKWLMENRPFVDWRGKTYRCSGASQLGDVWLKDDNDGMVNAWYTERVDVAELSNWRPAFETDSAPVSSKSAAAEIGEQS